jgi:hypothetical protein
VGRGAALLLVLMLWPVMKQRMLLWSGLCVPGHLW